MYLASLHIKNFRCLSDVNVILQPGLNVILGENNAGKTALLDAIRLVLGLGGDRRDLYLSEDDFYHDKSDMRATVCEVHAVLKDLSPEECGGFSACLAPSLGPNVAQIHVRGKIATQGNRRRVRFRSWGGEFDGESIPPETLEGIRAVYLEALRDPRTGLRPGRSSRVARLVQLLADSDAEESRLTAIAKKANDDIEADDLVRRAVQEINQRLKGVTGAQMCQTAEVRLTPPEFRRITESLRALVGSGNTLEIDENGLGYNNLLYIATVLGELQRAKQIDETDLALLLIEEPEAHLHPHLQTVLIDYLQSVSTVKTSTEHTATSDLPVQVVVTTHSPTLAARAQLDALTVLHISADGRKCAFSIAACPLLPHEKTDLQRYLDVTKAQLFFSKAVIFVEGISEALVVPELARLINQSLEESFISVVNVQGLAFAPFAKLFGTDRYAVRGVIVSDSDPDDLAETEDQHPETLSATAKKLQNLQSDCLRVELASKTFEYDLALAGNADRLAEEYKRLRPKKGAAALAAVQKENDDAKRADAFFENFDARDKGRFAQRLAQAIADDPASMNVPAYIRRAIEFAIHGEASNAHPNTGLH